MSQNRNIKYLNDRRIIYGRLPITDEPTHVYEWGYYYDTGTYQCYDLFKNEAKINTFKSLKWHLLVLWYLNSELNKDTFDGICKFIADKANGFVTFTISEGVLNSMLNDISVYDLDINPKNKLRKIIFKPFCGLTKESKLRIVGKMIGRSKSIHEDDIYQCMLELNDNNKKITIVKISKMLNCSTRSIYRNISDSLKKEKDYLNKSVRK
mgnify:CR=1 FL=1|tara:strand:- start:124 stop:750 length:627 start_codon:yes stop_codon:yes gene_type:complete